MWFRDLRRTTTFRLTALYGAIFVVGTLFTLAFVYLQSTAYLTRRVDSIVLAHADALQRAPRDQLIRQIKDALALDGEHLNVYALYSPGGALVIGNLPRPPVGLALNGAPVEASRGPPLNAYARLVVRSLPGGEFLAVGRDVSQLRQMRVIISSAMIGSGALTLVLGLSLGIGLSVGPLRRVNRLQAAVRQIADGDLTQRLPTSRQQDELDMFAQTVNHMVDEVARLMSEVKSSTDTIAHDLRTPLTRARARLHRLQHDVDHSSDDIGRVIIEVDEVLDRFQALLRLSELESAQRRAFFAPTDLGQVLAEAVDLYTPLAEEAGLALVGRYRAGCLIVADAKLLFEAVSNLVDNAIKFSPPGAVVDVQIEGGPSDPSIVVTDRGPGIAPDARGAVLQRFYREASAQLTPGSGLGLSVVSAIVRLHHFELRLEDAQPGLRAVIHCRLSSSA